MHWLDIVILVALGLGLAMGFYTGLLWQIARVVGLGLSIYVSILVNNSFTDWLSSQWKDINPVVLQIAAFGIAFLAVYLALYLLTRLLHKVLKATKLEIFDRLLGALLGAAKMAAVVAGVLGVMAAIDLEIFREWFDQATLARPFAEGTDVVVNMIPQEYRDQANEGFKQIREQAQKKLAEAAADALKPDEPKK